MAEENKTTFFTQHPDNTIENINPLPQTPERREYEIFFHEDAAKTIFYASVAHVPTGERVIGHTYGTEGYPKLIDDLKSQLQTMIAAKIPDNVDVPQSKILFIASKPKL